MNGYSEETAREILRKINSKGWNAYQRIQELDPDEGIRNGPAQELALERYVLLPVADDPRNPEDVFNALEKLSQKRNREMPTITANGETQALTGFSLHEDIVKIHTPSGTYVNYPDFLDALDTIVDAAA